MEDKIILSALPSYPGYRVSEDLGLVYAFDDDFQLFRNLWQMEESFERVKAGLRKKAEKMGADAVLGISMCLAPEKSLPVLMGTAVKLEKEETE